MQSSASGRFTGVVLSFLLLVALLLPAAAGPGKAIADETEVFAVVQMPDRAAEDTIKSAVLRVIDVNGLLAIVGATQAQLDALQANGYAIIEQKSGTLEESLAQFYAGSFLLPVPNVMGTMGGPDDFGYVFFDSNERNGPDFKWIDITGSGTDTGITGDDQGVVVPIGFDFMFFGKKKSQVGVSSNGYLTFGNDLTDWTNDNIPNTNDPNDAVFVFWDDLFPPSGGTIYYDTRGSRPNRTFVVEWFDIPHISDRGTPRSRYTFEVILYESSNGIKMQYRDMRDGSQTYADGNSATVGIENKSGLGGLLYSFSSPVISDGLAIKYCYPGLPCGEITLPTTSEKPRASGGSPARMTPGPAEMSTQYLSVNPQQTYAGQPVTITTNAVNNGGTAGNYSLALSINGQVEETRTVSVGPNGTQPVMFTVTRTEPGTYEVSIGGQKAMFTVLSAAGSTQGSGVNSGLIAMLALGLLVIAAAAVLVFSFRRPTRKAAQ